VPKSKKQKLTILPTEIVTKIKSLNLTRIQEDKCYHLISIIINKSKKDNNNLFSFVELPSAYLKKIFSKNYKNTINILLDNNIIICNNYFCNYENNIKSLNYKINNIYNYNINSLYNNYSYVTYMWEHFNQDTNYELLREYFLEDIKSLNIDTDKLLTITKNRIESLSINDFKTNSQINRTVFNVKNINGNYEKEYYTSLDNALETAKENNISLIQDKNKFYLMNETEFISKKKQFIYLSYLDSIKKIKIGYWYSARNNTNKRLDSNITNMCSELVDEICKDNNLVQIDLMNSQFSILSYILPKELDELSDIKLFKQLSYSGELYDYLKDIMCLDNRKEAKYLTFELLFSSHKNKDPRIKKLREIFPNVINYINDYKKKNGYKTFAVMLQNKESQIFIDDIWYELKKKGFFCLTKHDSFIVKKEDVKEITEYIQLYFDSIGFEGKLKTDNMEKLIIDTKIRKKLAYIKSTMKYRTKEICDWSIDEFYLHFNDWENHGKLWQIDHIHPIYEKEKYKGNINDLSNLQKLTVKEHSEKTINERKYNPTFTNVLDLIAKKRTRDSKQKIYEILECWDFEKYGKISIRNISNNFNISKKTIAKYYSEFKAYIIEINNEYKNK
jgi:hypothetical protein